MEGKEFDLIVHCWNCGEENGVPDELLDAIEEMEVDEIALSIDDVVSTDDAVDYIFEELIKDGFVPTTGAIRAVLRYFHGYCVDKLHKHEEGKDEV